MSPNLSVDPEIISFPTLATPDRLIRIEEVKAIVGLGKTMIYALAGRDQFPKPVKICGASRWSQQEIFRWIDEQKSQLTH